MATVIVMPKQGNSVESCIINQWHKQVGDVVNEGDVLCEAETDKAVVEVESTAAGTLLAQFFTAGAEVPVMTAIAAVGRPGENFDDLRPGQAAPAAAVVETSPVVAAPVETVVSASDGDRLKISPRAKNLAARKQLDPTALTGSGPAGRIIERDVQAALEAQPAMTPLARKMVAAGDFDAPGRGSGVRGRITAADLTPAGAETPPAVAPAVTDEVEVIPLKGVRKIIAGRMLESLQTTAQLTLNAAAPAEALQAYRRRLKASDEALGLRGITINDLVLLAVARVLPRFPDLNARFTGEAVHRHKNVQLGMAVDTPRGLMVPVIRQANLLSLRQLSGEAKRLATACLDSKIAPDELSGGTFTVTNLGVFGIESFTPVLNAPEVAILGVGSIVPKPVQTETGVAFAPHLNLSLTINHQVVDGAPAARFLQALAQGLADIDLLLAI